MPFLPHTGRKEDSENLVLKIKEEIWTTCDALDVMNLEIIKEIVLKLEMSKGKRKKLMSRMKEKNLILKDLRRRKQEIYIMIEIIFLFK